MPTHPPLFSLHFIGLACLSITLDKSLILFLIHEVLDWFGKCFSHLWGFIIFGKYPFLIFMSCLHTTWFYLWGIDYLCTLLFIIIQWKYTLQYSSLHSCDLVSILLSIFHVYACENDLSSKIYFLCLFLASLLIALGYYFYNWQINNLHPITFDWTNISYPKQWELRYIE